MRIKTTCTDAAGRITGYTIWLSADDTEAWAHKPTAYWPCSAYSGKRLAVCVDSNGLCDLAVNGRDDSDGDGDELAAMVGDHLPKEYRHLWPTWA